MPERAQRLVAILYEHPLLGEGIARMLLVETGAEVVAAPAGDRDAVDAVLARDPDIVIFERGRCGLDPARLSPRAVVIDVSAAMGTASGASAATADLETIILALRDTEVPLRSAGSTSPTAPPR